MKDDHAFLLDIAEAARLALQFAQQVDKKDFLEDELTQSAVIHQLLIVGEATKRLSDTFRQEHEEVPWSSMARMRDRLIHGYDSIKLNIVWDTATKNMLHLLERLEPLLPERDE